MDVYQFIQNNSEPVFHSNENIKNYRMLLKIYKRKHVKSNEPEYTKNVNGIADDVAGGAVGGKNDTDNIAMVLLM